MTFEGMIGYLEDENDSLFIEGLVAFPEAVSWRNENGVTLLHLSARNGRTRLVATLLRMGADPLARDQQRRSPLHDAAINYADSLPSLHLLMRAGADVDARDVYWRTPLMTACNYSNLYAVSAFVAWGAEDRFRDRRGLSARDHVESALAAAERSPSKYQEQIRDCRKIQEVLGGGDDSG